MVGQRVDVVVYVSDGDVGYLHGAEFLNAVGEIAQSIRGLPWVRTRLAGGLLGAILPLVKVDFSYPFGRIAEKCCMRYFAFAVLGQTAGVETPRVGVRMAGLLFAGLSLGSRWRIARRRRHRFSP